MARAFTHGTIQVYFQSQRAGVNGNLTQRLVDFIGGTKVSLDCAIYDLRHPQVLQALADAVQRGVAARIAYDGGKQRAGGMMADPKPSGSEQAIKDAGLDAYAQAIHEGRYLMHDKFLVRDSDTVWTGSANFTQGGLELQDNNCLVIASPELAASYAQVFNHLLTKDHQQLHRAHATSSASGVAAPSYQVSGGSATPYFSPENGEDIENAIVNVLQGARKVRVLAFLMSDPGILGALAPFASANVDIKGVYDPHGMQDVLRSTHQDNSLFWFTQDARFVAAPSHAFHPQREQDFMHNKVMIIDDHLVVTGSYNFSENAESNDENILLLDSQEIASAYTAYFDTLYSAYGGQ